MYEYKYSVEKRLKGKLKRISKKDKKLYEMKKIDNKKSPSLQAVKV